MCGSCRVRATDRFDLEKLNATTLGIQLWLILGMGPLCPDPYQQLCYQALVPSCLCVLKAGLCYHFVASIMSHHILMHSWRQALH